MAANFTCKKLTAGIHIAETLPLTQNFAEMTGKKTDKLGDRIEAYKPVSEAEPSEHRTGGP
jgi:hypothetical protein